MVSPNNKRVIVKLKRVPVVLRSRDLAQCRSDSATDASVKSSQTCDGHARSRRIWKRSQPDYRGQRINRAQGELVQGGYSAETEPDCVRNARSEDVGLLESDRRAWR